MEAVNLESLTLEPAPLPEVQERSLVIAIDYGTTYTGVAFATPVGNRANLHEIRIVKDWGPRMDNHEKIPSVYSYSLRSQKLEAQWGTDLSPQAIAMVHTKLQLDVVDTMEELDLILQALEGMHNLDFRYIRDSTGKPKYTIKGPEKIAEDYLTKVFECVLSALDEDISEELRTEISVDIVATIPAEWGYRAKNSTFRALTKAGFNRETFPELREMLLVSEPEAAAIYTARILKEENGADFLRKNECFVLCDAGGGTVDVVSYQVKQLEPTFEIEPYTKPTGKQCGSIFINLAFKRWLRRLIGERNYQQLDQAQVAHKIGSHDAEGERMRALMKSFDIYKKKFEKGHRDIKIDLPEPFENLDMDTRVVGGQITITYADMESFFEECADPIVGLIHGQLEQIEAKGKHLRNVFLVGGFAESPYLKETIEDSMKLRGLQLRIPDTSWTAVVRGAAIFGIEKSTNRALTSMRPCTRSYGISFNPPFSNVAHDIRDRVKDPLTQTIIAKDQLTWLIKKGDVILSDEAKEVTGTFTKNVPEAGPRTGTIPIYAYDGDDDLPDRLFNSHGEITKIHELKYDLKDVPQQEFTRGIPVGEGSPFFVAPLRLTMRQDPQALHIELRLKHRVICTTDIPEPLIETLE